MTPERIADAVLSDASGAIAVINLFQGNRIGQFSDDELREIFLVWASLVEEFGLTDIRVGGALALLRVDYQTLSIRFPKLSDPYLRDKRRDATKHRRQRRAAVRDAFYVPTWAETIAFEDDGIDFRSGPGTASFQKLKGSADVLHAIRLKPNATVTNPTVGERAVLFVTLAEPLWSELAAQDFDLRADFARNQLGLVHMESDSPQIILFFESDQIEARKDRGRPTAIDSGGNPRFVCCFENTSLSARCWGFTADLEAIGNRMVLPGRPERVCGAFPPPQLRGGLTLQFGFLGAPKVPRDDRLGIGDGPFSLQFEQYTFPSGPPLRETIVKLLNGGSVK